LSVLADEAADHVLLGDVHAASRSGCFPNFPPLSDGQHFQLLLSFITGVSEYRLCRMFLLDRNAVESILHDFQIRFSKTFLWLEKFRETTPQWHAFTQTRRHIIGRAIQLGQKSTCTISVFHSRHRKSASVVQNTLSDGQPPRSNDPRNHRSDTVWT
jgi:hypothetical protein